MSVPSNAAAPSIKTEISSGGQHSSKGSKNGVEDFLSQSTKLQRSENRNMRYLLRCSRRKLMCLLITLLVVALVAALLTVSLLAVRPRSAEGVLECRPTPGPDDPPALVVHLDLKGSPPTMPFLERFLRLIAHEGADGLLIEYEDMFPFEGRLASLSARNAYTKDQVQQILRWAADLRLKVIPLVQTFGHLEYVLKHPEFKHLREQSDSPQALCPSHPEAMALVEEMVRQVMGAHVAAATPPVRFLHVGCDEVELGQCRRCQNSGLSSKELFVSHVKKVARMVRGSFPNVTPLIWDDMMRSLPRRYLYDDAELASLVEPVVWVYTPQIAPQVTPSLWYTYGRVFKRVWAAAAYRGASGPAAPAPHLEERLRNVAAWRRRQLGPPGEPQPAPASLVLTGWARYTHFEVLTELLPVAVPSLVLALQAAREEEPLRDLFQPEQEAGALLLRWRRTIGCPLDDNIPVFEDPNPYQWELMRCNFTGVEAFKAVATCERALDTAENLLRKASGETSVVPLMEYAALDARRQLDTCRAGAAAALPRYVDAAALREWMEERVEPLDRLVEQLQRLATAERDGGGSSPAPPPPYVVRLITGFLRRPGQERRWWPMRSAPRF